jgi:hypothetical protein
MRNCLLLALLVCSTFLNASVGDTIRVQAHRNVDMPWYGNYDAVAAFPATGSYRQILMHYTLGCPASGCSDWDYTTQIFLMRPTGNMDTAIAYAPMYRLDGNAFSGSLELSSLQTYTTYYDSVNLTTDSVMNTAGLLRVYGDTTRPYIQTDSMLVYEAGYYNYYFDASGQIYDSLFVSGQLYMQYLSTVNNPYEVLEPFELGRVITPYGGNLPASWTRRFTYDVTDFAPLLKDSVLMRAFCSCWSNGWRVSLDFEFIEGQPERKVSRVLNVYNGNFTYGTPGFENNYPTRRFAMAANEKELKLRFTPTGHSFGGTADNCAEFCERSFYVNLNNALVYTQSMWRDDCGLNPTFPQAGTWLIDRANWCPGDRGLNRDFELGAYVSPGSSFDLNVDLEPFNYTGPSDKTPVHTVESQLFFYEEPRFDRDLAVTDILRPSSNFDYSRMNPICANPAVRITNHGKLPVTEAILKYGIKGEAQFTKYWSGYLGPNQSETLELSGVLLPSSATSEFEAFTLAPNGLQDENTWNDTLRSIMQAAPAYDSSFIIVVKPNNDFVENSWILKNELGNVVYRRDAFSSNALVRDTVSLQPGCYEFEFYDTGKDGLYFAFNVQTSGTGYVRFQRANGSYINNFKNDFGSKLRQHFTVGTPDVVIPVSVQEPGLPVFELYPNPAHSQITLDLSGGMKGEVLVQVTDLAGRELYRSSGRMEGSWLHHISVGDWPAGTVLVHLNAGGAVQHRKMVIHH